jgi:hypothetical protein
MNPLEEAGKRLAEMNESYLQMQRVQHEGAQRVQSALKATIKLPEQIDILTEEIGKLIVIASVQIEIAKAQKQLGEELLKIAASQKQLAEESGKQSKNLSDQTDRLVGETIVLRRFTKGVFWLTVVISIFTLVQIIITCLDYSTKAHERIESGVEQQSTQNHQAGHQ